MLLPPARRRIAASIEAKPLEPGEIRRIEGMGGHFICLQQTELPDDYAALASFDFNGVPTLFVRKF